MKLKTPPHGAAFLFFCRPMMPSLLLLHSHHCYLRKPFFECWRTQLRGHAPHDIFRNYSLPPLIAFQANFHWHVKEHGLHFISIIFGQFDPAVALVRCEVGCVYVVCGTTRDQPGFQHRTQIGKNQILKSLLRSIVKQKCSQQIAGERRDVMALEPRTLSGARQSDGQNYNSPRTRTSSRQCPRYCNSAYSRCWWSNCSGDILL